jgi:hypothetical protein
MVGILLLVCGDYDLGCPGDTASGYLSACLAMPARHPDAAGRIASLKS